MPRPSRVLVAQHLFVLQCLDKRLAGRRKPAPGLVHHFDRGVQYASRDYTGLLQANGIVLSMSRKCNPWDTRVRRSSKTSTGVDCKAERCS